MTLFGVSLVCGCGPASPGGPSSRKFAASLGQSRTDLYLSPSEASGGKLCFNPDSPRLRALLTAPRARASDPIDARGLSQDLPFLQDLLRLQYSGYAQIVQRADFDLPLFFEQWQSTLVRAGATIPFDQGVLDPLRTLRALFPDNHHAVWGPSLGEEPAFVVREYQAIVRSADAVGALASCIARGAGTAFPHTLRLASVLRPEGTTLVLTVSVRGGGDRVSVQCPGGTFDLVPRPTLAKRAAPTPMEELYAWRGLGDTAVITVRRFAGTGAQEKQLERLVRDYDAHRRFARIVFDLRGNGGGNDSAIYDWVAKAKRGLWSAGAEWELQGALTPCQTWNVLVQRQIQDRTVDTPDARSERAKIRAEWPKGPHPATWLYRPGLIDGQAERPYSGQVFVLVDRYSGSSGESGALTLKRALGATLIGERTDGTIEFSDQRTFILPHSGVRWSFGSKRNLFEEPVEGVGIPVDLYLADPAAPVEQIVSMLTADRLLMH